MDKNSNLTASQALLQIQPHDAEIVLLTQINRLLEIKVQALIQEVAHLSTAHWPRLVCSRRSHIDKTVL